MATVAPAALAEAISRENSSAMEAATPATTGEAGLATTVTRDADPPIIAWLKPSGMKNPASTSPSSTALSKEGRSRWKVTSTKPSASNSAMAIEKPSEMGPPASAFAMPNSKTTASSVWKKFPKARLKAAAMANGAISPNTKMVRSRTC